MVKIENKIFVLPFIHSSTSNSYLTDMGLWCWEGKQSLTHIITSPISVHWKNSFPHTCTKCTLFLQGYIIYNVALCMACGQLNKDFFVLECQSSDLHQKVKPIASSAQCTSIHTHPPSWLFNSGHGDILDLCSRYILPDWGKNAEWVHLSYFFMQ